MNEKLAQATVSLEFSRLGLPLFTSRHGTSAIDLIVPLDDLLMKVQTFYLEKRNGQYVFLAPPTGLHNQCPYQSKDVDLFALYCSEDEKVAWVLGSGFVSGNKGNTVRLRSPEDVPKVGLKKDVSIDDYADLKKVIKDFKASHAPALTSVAATKAKVVKPKAPKP